MEPKQKVDGVYRDFGDDPDDFDYKNRFKYQEQDWSYSMRGDKYECECSKCEGNNDPNPY